MPITLNAQLLPLEALGASGKNYGASGISSFLQPLDGSGLAYHHSTAAIILPVLEITAEISFGGTLGAEIRLPRLTARGDCGASAAIVLPAIMLSATGNVPPMATAAVILPMLVVAASGTTGVAYSAELQLPQLVVSMRLGGHGAAVLPRLLVAGVVSTEEKIRAAIRLPLLRTAGTIVLTSQPGAAAIVLPTLRAGPYGAATITLPSLQVVAVAVVDTGDFEGWALNVRNNAITRLTNFPFTQLVSAGNKTYAIGSAGLYLLGGDTDAGDPIVWQFETGLDNLGRVGVKHFPYLYLDGIVDGVIEIVLIDDRGREFAYHYDTKQRGAVHLKHRRKLGNGIRTSNVAFRIRSDTGAYIELDALEPEVTVTQRSI